MRPVLIIASFAVTVLLASIAPISAGPLEDAEAAYDAGDYTAALQIWRDEAGRGSAQAQRALGDFYSYGIVVPHDLPEAAKWYRLEAEQGGADAQVRLAILYQDGLGVPRDIVEAVKWFRLAAEQGDVFGQYNLGEIYRKGDGVPQNYAEAAKWYELAAKQRHWRAQRALGRMYAGGEGVPQDNVLAHAWLNLASSSGYAEKEERDAIGELLTPEQMAEAQKLAADWFASIRRPANYFGTALGRP